MFVHKLDFTVMRSFSHGRFCLSFMGHTHTTYNLKFPIIHAIVSIPAYHPFIAGIAMILRVAHALLYKYCHVLSP